MGTNNPDNNTPPPPVVVVPPVTPATPFNFNVFTDTMVTVNQSNTMNDSDTINPPLVQNLGEILQTAAATGVSATSGDGIVNGIGVGALSMVGDDLVMAGSTQASSTATAAAVSGVQAIETGVNVQSNGVAIDIVGSHDSDSDIGNDDTGSNVVGTVNVSNPAGTLSNIVLGQTNNLTDIDSITGPEVHNQFNNVGGPSFQQNVDATGGTATAGDGNFSSVASVVQVVNVGDDLAVSGIASAIADATGSATGFTQDIETGRNQQFNVATASIVGINRNTEGVGEDKTAYSTVLQDNAIVTGGTDTNAGTTNAPLAQTNTAADQDTILTPKVHYTSGEVAGVPHAAAADDFYQDVTVTGGSATAGHGINNTNAVGRVVTANTIGDDGWITGQASASADATAAATAFAQTLSTGGNVQVNQLTMDIVGASQNLSDIGQDGVPRSAAFGDAGNGPVATDVVATQANTLNDSDTITTPEVLNLVVAAVDGNLLPANAIRQQVLADGGTATAEEGIASAASVAVGLVGDDMTMLGTSSADASAAASAAMFTQDIAMGGNVQFNAKVVSVIGGNETDANVGEDRSGAVTTPGSGFNIFTAPVLTTTNVGLTQTNTLTDVDVVSNARVYNASDSGVVQNVTALGGNATSLDGIDATSLYFGNGSLVTPDVGDDLSVEGAASAIADASASAEAFTQVISTGGNVMVNNAAVSVIGANRTDSGTGHDDAAEGNFYLGSLTLPASGTYGTTTVVTINQSNGTLNAPAIDQDQILNPRVENDQLSGNVGPDDPDVRQTVAATGGIAQSGDGIVLSAAMVGGSMFVGDDATVIGSAATSADADATAEAFTQDLESGRNTQQNAMSAAIVGANQNGATVGEDDLAGGYDLIMGGYNFKTMTTIDVDQVNSLNDQDVISNPQVLNRGDVVQTATATGGTAGNAGNPGNGIAGGNAAANIDVGDDFEVDGSSIASADATAYVEAFTQNISTGGNVQVNSASASVVGINDTVQAVGEDDGDDATDILPNDTLAPIILPLDPSNPGNPLPGTDSTFTFDQVNSLFDQDQVTGAHVINHLSGDIGQTVTAFGGTATAGNGIDGGASGLLGTYDVGDNFLMEGTSSASADASAIAEAFTQNIVMGANVQVNALSVSVVGGSSTVSTVGEDDLV